MIRSRLLDETARRAVDFFWKESHPDTGLTKDRARNDTDRDDYTVASVAATGFALAGIAIGAERKWLPREQAAARARATLRFLGETMPHEHGFFYHFVDWRTGERVWKCELSSIDSALLFLGALAAGRAFGGEVAERADALLARADWPWMQNRKAGEPESRSLTMGWKPEDGFLASRWENYHEGSFLYLLALGAPTHPLPPSAWDAWTFPEATVEGFRVFGGPTPAFWAQMTPAYYDLRGQRDRQKRDWWVHFADAHRANAAFCARHAGPFKTYEQGVWGITACDQPPPVGYGAQSPREGDHDGTIAPTAALAGVVFVPREAERAAASLRSRFGEKAWGRYGFPNALNADKDWFDRDVLGIDLGMALLGMENRRAGTVWRWMRGHPVVRKGLDAAGFHRPAR